MIKLTDQYIYYVTVRVTKPPTRRFGYVYSPVAIDFTTEVDDLGDDEMADFLHDLMVRVTWDSKFHYWYFADGLIRAAIAGNWKVSRLSGYREDTRLAR